MPPVRVERTRLPFVAPSPCSHVGRTPRPVQAPLDAAMTRRDRAQALNRLVAETKAAQLAAAGWHPISTIPRDQAVTVHTLTGIECRAEVHGGASVHNGMIECRRRDGQGGKGPIKAVAWRGL